jgi:hypothetical protein
MAVLKSQGEWRIMMQIGCKCPVPPAPRTTGQPPPPHKKQDAGFIRIILFPRADFK